MYTEDMYWHAFGTLRPLFSGSRIRELLYASQSLEAAWEASDETLLKLGWTDEQRTRFSAHRDVFSFEHAYETLTTHTIHLVHEKSPLFPAQLRTISDPPFLLYVRGNLDASLWGAAFVGSRNATAYGKTATNLLVRPLAAKGVAIVSGLAYGIDAEAHRSALAVHGYTIGVLGSGLDSATLYPRAHTRLGEDIVNAGGALVSEYPPLTQPKPFYFPQRNRIISGLSRAVVVVEANKESGALITARTALDQNRDVFVVPGPITSPLSEGTNALLQEGAAPALSADDILELFARKEVLPSLPPVLHTAPSAVPPSRLSPNEDLVLQILSPSPAAIDEIVKRSTLAPNVVASLLTVLELDGRIRDVGGRQYIRV